MMQKNKCARKARTASICGQKLGLRPAKVLIVHPLAPKVKPPVTSVVGYFEFQF
jgi:hypothetical protein